MQLRKLRPVQLSVLVCAGLTAMSGLTTTAYAQTSDARQVEFHIASISLSDALLQIGRQTGTTITFEVGTVQGLKSGQVQGVLTVEQAIKAALSGTSLEYGRGPDNSFVVTKQPQKAGAGKASAAAATEESQQVVIKARRRELGYAADSSREASRTDTSLLDTSKSVSTMPSELLQDQQATDVFDALHNASGVRMDQEGGALPTIEVRGFTAEQAMTNGLMTGSDVAFTTPSIGIDRIEVIKGPESIIGGVAAKFGGLVNLVTKTPTADTSKEIELTTNSKGRAAAGVDINGPLSEDHEYRGRVVASAEDTGKPYSGWDSGTDYYLSPSIARKTATSNLVIAAFFQNTTKPMNMGAEYFGGSKVQGTGTEYSHAADDASLIRSRRLSIDYDNRFDSGWKLGLRGQYSFDETKSDFWLNDFFALPIESAPIADIAYESVSTDRTITFQSDLSRDFSLWNTDHRVITGFDFTGEKSKSNAVYKYGDDLYFSPDFGETQMLPSVKSLPNVYLLPYQPWSGSNEKSAFVQDQASIGESWQLLGSLRYVKVGPRPQGIWPSISKVLPSVGVVYKLTPKMSVYGSYTQGVNYTVAGTTVTGDSLPPTEAKQSEVGFKAATADDRLVFTTAVYKIVKSNVPEADINGDGYFYIVKGQVSQGVEIELNGRLAPSWNISASFTNENLRSDPEANYMQARNRYNLWIQYRALKDSQFDGWNGALGIVARGKEDYIVPAYNYDGVNPGGGIVNAVVGYDAKAWNFKLGVKNLFGRNIYTAGSIPSMATKELKDLVTLTTQFKF